MVLHFYPIPFFLSAKGNFPGCQEYFPFKDLKRTFKDLKHTFKDLKHTFKVFERKIARGSGKFSPGEAEKKALTEFNYCKQSIKAGPGMQEKAYLCGRKPKRRGI